MYAPSIIISFTRIPTEGSRPLHPGNIGRYYVWKIKFSVLLAVVALVQIETSIELSICHLHSVVYWLTGDHSLSKNENFTWVIGNITNEIGWCWWHQSRITVVETCKVAFNMMNNFELNGCACTQDQCNYEYNVEYTLLLVTRTSNDYDETTVR